MIKCKIFIFVLTTFTLTALTSLSGCVERRLTINTKPQKALVELNDEQIGVSPVTTSFEWYGDYNVRITKAGCETLKTHRKLKAPWYDTFPFDFFALIYPKRIVDEYQWDFELETKKQPSRQQLIEDAKELKEQL